MILAGPCRPAVAITASPTGPAPITATTSPGFTCPYWTPISKPVGRMSLSSTPCWFVTPSGTLYTDVSAYGTRTYSAWVPSIRCPKTHPIPDAPSSPRQCAKMPCWQKLQ